MADSRFFDRSGPFSLEQLAHLVGGVLGPTDDPAWLAHDVAPIDRAGPDAISFLEDRRLADRLATCRAGACLVPAEGGPPVPAGMRTIRVARPQLAFVRVARLFYPEPPLEPAVHPRAVVDPSARLGEGCRIEAGAVIGPRVELGPRCLIGPNAVIDAGCVLGADCRIGAGVTISHAVIGARVTIWPGARIGQAGFGFVPGETGLERVPQLGRVLIHDGVDIGANTTIDRGAGEDTEIGPGCIIDNLVQIAHNVHLGKGCILVSQVGISGSTRLGDHVVLGGQAGLSDHLKIGKGARVAAQGGVMRDIEPGGEVGGSPAVPIRQWHRQTLALARLARKKGD